MTEPDRCPTCRTPHFPGQTRPQSFTCPDPWHSAPAPQRESEDVETVLRGMPGALADIDGDYRLWFNEDAVRPALDRLTRQLERTKHDAEVLLRERDEARRERDSAQDRADRWRTECEQLEAALRAIRDGKKVHGGHRGTNASEAFQIAHRALEGGQDG